MGSVAVLLLAAVVLALAGLLAAPGTASADDVERANCPPGFTWVRTSGTGCVQDPLPPHGKTGYDGHPLCVEPYIGIFESRKTTDGEPAPGSPYTSFAYLKKCVTKAQYDAAIQREKDKQGTSPGGGMPGTVQTGVAGLAVVAGLTVLGGAAVLVNRHRNPTPDELAEQDRKLRRQHELEEQLAAATERRDRIDALLTQVRTQLSEGGWGIEAANNVAGLLASFASVPPGQTVAGVASLASTIGGAALGTMSTDEIHEQMNHLLENLELMSGTANAEVEAINADLADLDSQVEPDRLAAEDFTDYSVLQTQIDKVNAETRDLLQDRNGHDLSQAQIRVQIDDLDNKIDDLRNQRWDIEWDQIDHDSVAFAGTLASALAGVAALAATGGWAAVGLGGLSAAGSTASFLEYLRTQDVTEVKRVISVGIQGYQRVRGELLYKLENEARLQANAQKLLDNARAYHDRLREQQAQIALRTNRGVLWPK